MLKSHTLPQEFSSLRVCIVGMLCLRLNNQTYSKLEGCTRSNLPLVVFHLILKSHMK